MTRERRNVHQKYVKTLQGLRGEESGASGWEGFATDGQVQVKVDWVSLVSLRRHTQRLQPGSADMGERGEVGYSCDGVSYKGKLPLLDLDATCTCHMRIFACLFLKLSFDSTI